LPELSRVSIGKEEPMDAIELVTIACPHCGEFQVIQVERLSVPQNYVEDCQVCCRSMRVCVDFGERSGLPEVRVAAEP